jgi:hypothetical protein
MKNRILLIIVALSLGKICFIDAMRTRPTNALKRYLTTSKIQNLFKGKTISTPTVTPKRTYSTTIKSSRLSPNKALYAGIAAGALGAGVGAKNYYELRKKNAKLEQDLKGLQAEMTPAYTPLQSAEQLRNDPEVQKHIGEKLINLIFTPRSEDRLEDTVAIINEVMHISDNKYPLDSADSVTLINAIFEANNANPKMRPFWRSLVKQKNTEIYSRRYENKKEQERMREATQQQEKEEYDKQMNDSQKRFDEGVKELNEPLQEAIGTETKEKD